MSKKIAILGLTSNENIGDYLLVESAKFLVTKIQPEARLTDIDVDPRDLDIYSGRRMINLKLFEILTRYEKAVFAVIGSQRLRYYYQYFYWWIKLNWYYKSVLRGYDGIIIAGGGFLKFKTQGLNYLDELIIKIAQKRNIPVMFNAVGIEGYSETDIRCQRLKKTINSSIVKVITTRDDIETLQNNYIINKEITTERVGDPVFWLRDMMSIDNKKNRSTGRIGINLVNPNNFARYGGSVNKYTVENFYKNLIQELNQHDADFYLYTNGMQVDQDFGERLLKSMNLPHYRLLRKPETSADFVQMTMGFDVIMSGRMHAGIVAYALDIPLLGLIWGEKIDFFAKITGIRENYFNENEMDSEKIVDMLVSKKVKRANIKIKKELKNKTYEYLEYFLNCVG